MKLVIKKTTRKFDEDITMRTRKLWNIKTTLKPYLSDVDVVTKYKVLLITSFISLLSPMGLFYTAKLLCIC